MNTLEPAARQRRETMAVDAGPQLPQRWLGCRD